MPTRPTAVLLALWLAITPALPARATPPSPHASPDPASATQAAEPTAPPSLPAQPPPRASAKTPSASTSTGTRLQLNLPTGFSVVSFPFARLTRVTGLTHQLYRFSGGAFVVTDPVSDPGGVDTRLGYVAYAEAPTAVLMEGLVDDTVKRSLSLPQGWSLVGCPTSTPLAWKSATLTLGARTVGIADAISPNRWLGARAWPPTGPITLTGPQAGLSPGQATWIWTRLPVRLHLHPAATPAAATTTPSSTTTPAASGAPLITRLQPSVVGPGESVQIVGTGFGVDGDVTVSGCPVAPDDVLDWSPTCIQLKIPDAAASGAVTVTVNHIPSNGTPLTVRQRESGPATVMGQIVNDQGQAVANAQILLDSGQSAITGSNGAWLLTEVPAGQHLAYVTAVGYRLGVATLQVASGASQSVLIRLTLAGESPPTGGTPPTPAGGTSATSTAPVSSATSVAAGGWTPPPGGWAHWSPPPGAAANDTPEAQAIAAMSSTLAPPAPAVSTAASPAMRLVVDDYTSQQQRWWVRAVEVAPPGQATPRWQRSWTHDQRGASVTIDCPGATVGVTYSVRVTWAHDASAQETSRTFTRTLDAPDQTIEIDSPY